MTSFYAGGKEPLFQAGVPFSFSLLTRDSYSNKSTKGADRLSVTMQGGNLPVSSLTLSDNRDGSYSISHSVEQSGKFYVTAMLDQTPIAGCPYSLFVNGGTNYHFLLSFVDTITRTESRSKLRNFRARTHFSDVRHTDILHYYHKRQVSFQFKAPQFVP